LKTGIVLTRARLEFDSGRAENHVGVLADGRCRIRRGKRAVQVHVCRLAVDGHARHARIDVRVVGVGLGRRSRHRYRPGLACAAQLVQIIHGKTLD